MASDTTSTTKDHVKSDKKLQLPTEIMTMIVQHLADTDDHRSLGRLQRTSRDLYLLATPLLYFKLGTCFLGVMKQLEAAKRLTLRQIDAERDDYEDIEATAKHPIDFNQTSRLIWTCQEDCISTD